MLGVLADGDHCERSEAIPGRDAYVEAHALVADRWQNSRAWWRSGVLNTARMGWFSSDRAGAAGAWPPGVGPGDRCPETGRPGRPSGDVLSAVTRAHSANTSGPAGVRTAVGRQATAGIGTLSTPAFVQRAAELPARPKNAPVELLHRDIQALAQK